VYRFNAVSSRIIRILALYGWIWLTASMASVAQSPSGLDQPGDSTTWNLPDAAHQMLFPPHPALCPTDLPEAMDQALKRLDPVNTEQIETVLEAGSPILMMLETPVSTHQNQLGDPVEASTVHDIFLYNRIIIPRRTRFYGTIHRLEVPYAGRNPMIGFTFNTMQTPTGPDQPITAYVRTGNKARFWGGELTEGTQPRLVRHGVMGIGYYNQVFLDGPRRRGEPVVFPPGSMWMLVLEQPLALPTLRPARQLSPLDPSYR
jgi:hypothetical protein